MTKKQFGLLLTQLTALAASYSLAFYAAIVNAFNPVAKKYGVDFNPAPAKATTQAPSTQAVDTAPVALDIDSDGNVTKTIIHTPAVDTAALIGEDWHERDLPQLLHPCFGKLKFDASKVTVKHIDAAAGLTAHDFTSITSGQCLVHAITDKQFYISTRVQSLAGDTLTLHHYQFSGGTRAPLIFAIDDFDNAEHGSFVEFYINGEITVVHFNTTLVPVKTPAHSDASGKSPVTKFIVNHANDITATADADTPNKIINAPDDWFSDNFTEHNASLCATVDELINSYTDDTTEL